MSTQISLKLSDKMIDEARKYVDAKGFDSLQDFIRETIREKLFEQQFGMLASENSLGKKWLHKREDKA